MNTHNFVSMNATGEAYYYCGPGYIGLSDQHFKRTSYFLSFSVCSCIGQFSNNYYWMASKQCVRFLVCFVELKHCAFEFWGLEEVRAGALSNPLADNQTTSREKIKPFQAHDINSSIKNHNKMIALRNNKNNTTTWERWGGAFSNALADKQTTTEGKNKNFFKHMASERA